MSNFQVASQQEAVKTAAAVAEPRVRVVSAHVQDGQLVIKVQGKEPGDVDSSRCGELAWEERHKHSFTQGAIRDISPAYVVDGEASKGQENDEVTDQQKLEKLTKLGRIRYRRDVVIAVND